MSLRDKPLSPQAYSLQPLEKNILYPFAVYYFGEMIFAPEYRHRGTGKRMLEMLKNAGHEQDADQFCFLAVAREDSDVRCPAGHIDSALIFRRFGFVKTDVFVTFEWPTIQPDGRVEKTTNRLDLYRVTCSMIQRLRSSSMCVESS